VNHDKASKWEYIAPIAIACITVVAMSVVGGFINGAIAALQDRKDS